MGRQSPNATTGGLYLKLVDFHRLYESVADKVILINNFNTRNESERERLNKLLFTEYTDDVLDTVPSCECGRLRGEYNSSDNIRCKSCGTKVIAVTERPIESTLWMKTPEGVHGFISPAVWTVLNNEFKNIPRWLCDPTYKGNLTKESRAHIETFKERGWKRGLNYFIENFDAAMNMLSDLRVVKPASRRLRVEKYISDNKKYFFTEYLPIPNRSVFITEQTVYNNYRVDQVIHNAIDAVRTLTSLTTSIVPVTQRVKENRTIKIVDQLSEYYSDYIVENLSAKEGIFRQQVFGSRLDGSGRAVISSLSHPHKYNELHLPWGLSVLMMKTDITSKLLKRGYTPDSAERFLMMHTRLHHPLLEEIFNELLDESAVKNVTDHPHLMVELEKRLGKGRAGALSVIFQRNPSLVRGSAQQLYVTKIKTDPDINTISFSVLTLRAPNAD